MIKGAVNTNASPVEALPSDGRVTCDRCQTGVLRSGDISIAFWQAEGLVVVRNIPARLCPDCGEQYLDDVTVVRLDQLRGQRFAGMATPERIVVPVLDFGRSG
jgi:YgiT-type zinc finger domain-containing protein